MGTFLLILGLVLLVFFIYAIVSNTNKKKSLEGELRSKGLTLSDVKDILDGNDSHYIALDTNREFIVYLKADLISKSLKIIPINDIRKIRIEKDGEVVYQKSNLDIIKRAAVGGVLLGGVGALIGGLTASSKEIEKIKRVTLCISADNGNTSWIHFVSDTTPNSLKKTSLERAEKWCRIIENYMTTEAQS